MDKYAIVVNEGRPQSVVVEKIIRKDLSQTEIDLGEGKFGMEQRTSRLPLVDLPDPVYDPSIETLTGYGDFVDEGTRLTRVRTKRPLSQDELDEKDFQSRVENVIAALRAGVGQPVDRLGRIERVLIKLIKDRYSI